MSFEALGNIGDFAGGIGVLVTLVYLAAQIRQNTIATKADSYQAVVAAACDWSREIALSSEMTDIIQRGAADYENLEIHDRMRFGLVMASYFRNMENLHLKFSTGAVDELVWSGWANRTLSFLDAPGTRAWWELNENAFSPDFRHFIAHPPTDRTTTETFQPRTETQ